MTFRTILVHLDHSGRCAARASLAAQWARAHQAHLVGLIATGLEDGIIPADAILTGATDYIAESAEYLRKRAEGISREFREGIAASGALSHEVRLIDAVTVDAIVRHGRTADLVVVGQQDDAEPRDTTARDLPQRVLMETGRPVLVVPNAGRFGDIAGNVVVAWDGSRESAVALRAALPALKLAKKVTLLGCRAVHDNNADERWLLPELVRYLLRHGIEAATERDVTEIDAADELLSRISDFGADMLVMGGYGHSRFRELVLGGVTRQILAQMTVPVLIAH
jgi:nucleotide-binding universal stress UspA family protein